MSPEELIALLRAANVRVPPSGLLRAAQLRKFLGVSDRTLQSWRAQGKPPHGLKLNGQWSYPLTEVAKFLAT
jgi:predicted site-specific integrase-resolvase